MNITLRKSYMGFEIEPEDGGETVLVQTDWDFPGTADTFGWQACDCGFTDGTVDCEHRTASDMITEAYDYLMEHIGDTTEDPGYFGQD